MSKKFKTLKSLLKAIGAKSLKTREQGWKVYSVPTKRIARSIYGGTYTELRKPSGMTRKELARRRKSLDLGKEHWHLTTDSETVNHFRRQIRARKPVEPVHLIMHTKKHYPKAIKKGQFVHVTDGHHRLTAHQAQGIRRIRATIRLTDQLTPKQLRRIRAIQKKKKVIVFPLKVKS